MAPKTAKPDTHTYLWEGIPRDLWEKAQAKAAALEPPTSMKWILRQLVERWANDGGPSEKPKRLKKPLSLRQPKRPEPLMRAPRPSPAPMAVPDLGDSF